MNEEPQRFDPETSVALDDDAGYAREVDEPAGAVPPPVAPADPAARRGRNRKRAFLVLGIAIVLGLVAYGIVAWLAGGSESTDDAYVAGDIVAITAREPGNVTAIHADDTEAVKRGQVLVELDTATADARLAAARAHLAQAVRAVRSNFSQVDETEAEIAQARAELAKARSDLARRRSAAGEGAVSGEEVAHAADSVRTAEASLALAQSRHAQALSPVEGTGIRSNPDVEAAIAEYRSAAISRGNMKIAAPVDGVVAQRSVQLGEHVSPGTPLMAVVPLGKVWVDANFRETQLAQLRVGQPVTIVSDAYGGDVVFHGKVSGLGAGSGNAFALLPPQNASGNWIKIVQRVPVRIALDPRELARNPLRVGLSVKVTVDTGNHSGVPVARAAGTHATHEESMPGSPEVDRQIDAIIAANAGGRR